MAAVTYQEIKDSLHQLYPEDPRLWLVGFSGGSPREIRPTNHAHISTAPIISRGKDGTLVAALVFDAVLALPPEQRIKPITVLCEDRHNGSISHKRAQRPQRTGGANGFSLSGSNGERAGVRCRNSTSFRTRHSSFSISKTRQKGIIMSDWKETNRLRELQEQTAAEKGIRADTLRRLLGKVDEYSESHRAFGLPDDLLCILKDDLAEHGETVFS